MHAALFDQVRTCDQPLRVLLQSINCPRACARACTEGRRLSPVVPDGNFTTLTRFHGGDLELRSSRGTLPLNVSIHTTGPGVASSDAAHQRGADVVAVVAGVYSIRALRCTVKWCRGARASTTVTKLDLTLATVLNDTRSIASLCVVAAGCGRFQHRDPHACTRARSRARSSTSLNRGSRRTSRCSATMEIVAIHKAKPDLFRWHGLAQVRFLSRRVEHMPTSRSSPVRSRRHQLTGFPSQQ